jgi:hypothetical protein
MFPLAPPSKKSLKSRTTPRGEVDATVTPDRRLDAPPENL